ncbi:sulfite exporter TauE/SafE family protein 2 isoform X2 [Morus notabilis]|uniref:sulfite exporter TauE/SafE family protein 2 isoform X2 n=1 Tax=Morus notabilis TaxID=981085 RepID=UPI000CED7F76|nr:sulfite exporter TauE/SafE family protein 2 isoform X2 [Morus notabilis]
MPPMPRPPTPTESRLTPAATTTTRAIVQVSEKSKRWATGGGRGACVGDLQRRAGFLCFIAASISSAGGVGGGGLFIPIMTITAGVDLKTASSFSAFMVTGASIANVVCNLASAIPRFAGKSLIDFDIALLSQPSMLLGVSVGVICNVMFPEWLVTILFAVFLAWSTSKTWRNGVMCWKLETEVKRLRKGCGELENGLSEDVKLSSIKEPLLGSDHQLRKCQYRLPWMKLGVVVLIWCSFCFVYLLRGNRYGEGITPIEPCGVGYWLLSSFQIPLAIVYTAWILCRKDSSQNQNLNQKNVMENLTQVGQSKKLIFPLMALLAGMLGGVFGIGGGMLISPLLLQVGVAPEVTAATCSFMVFFSSTMSAFQYLFLGMEHTDVALIFAAVCFVASLLGLVVVQKAIQEYGRASLIVFSVGIVMALSTVLMTTFGALDVWRDYISGEYMGFKRPC